MAIPPNVPENTALILPHRGKENYEWMSNVRLDRVDRDDKCLCHFSVGAPGGKELEDTLLLWSQLVERWRGDWGGCGALPHVFTAGGIEQGTRICAQRNLAGVNP